MKYPKKIEIEYRALLTKKEYKRLKYFLNANAKDLGKDNKDVYFFILPNKLLKVVYNISKETGEIVMKLNKIGKGADFEEIEIPISPKYIKETVKVFSLLNITDNIMHSYQKRHNYLFKNVEIGLKYSDIWKYHIELEIIINKKDKKKIIEAKNKIKNIANELNIKLMTDKELAEFTKKAEENYKKSKN